METRSVTSNGKANSNLEMIWEVVCPHCEATNQVPRVELTAQSKCACCLAALFEGHSTPVDARRFDLHLEHSDIPLLVLFWAPDCWDSYTVVPAFEGAASLLEPQVRLVKVNPYKEPGLALRLGIRNTPTIVLFRHQVELARMSGTRADLVSWARRTLSHSPLEHRSTVNPNERARRA